MCEIIETTFFCYRDGLKIFAKEFTKSNLYGQCIEKKMDLYMPAIIISHGFGENGTSNEKYCRAFAEFGYATYCFDFCGGSLVGEGRSDGNTTDMNVETECKDLIEVLKYVQSLPYIDKEHISFMGTSMGGFISGMTAAKCDGQIDNLIMLFPALCIPDDARLGQLGGGSYDINNVPEVIECPNKMKIGRQFYEKVKNMDPFLELRKFKGRVMLIQGMNDKVVNYSYAIKAKESYQKGQCQLQLIREAEHSFSDQQRESAIIAIEHFLSNKGEQLTIEIDG